MSDTLYLTCKRQGINPANVAEVGVYYPETSNVLGFIRDGVPAILVEADPDCVRLLKEYFGDRQNVRIYPIAVWDSNETISMCRANASTFVGALENSPALINDSYQKNDENRFEVQALRFSEIDNGDIDLLSIDIEGAEWYVLKHMTSRPRIISLETHGGMYTNPELTKIQEWMRDNQYERWFIDKTDTVFARNGVLDMGFAGRTLQDIRNRVSLLRYRLKAIKRRIKRRILKQK